MPMGGCITRWSGACCRSPPRSRMHQIIIFNSKMLKSMKSLHTCLSTTNKDDFMKVVDSERGFARAEDAHVTPTQSHISPSTLECTKIFWPCDRFNAGCRRAAAMRDDPPPAVYRTQVARGRLRGLHPRSPKSVQKLECVCERQRERETESASEGASPNPATGRCLRKRARCALH